MNQVVTELVIDSDTSGADQFSQSMDRASASAQSGTSSAASMGLAIAGVGVAVVAAVAGLRAFVDYVGAQSQALVDLSDHAAVAGVSVQQFQQILFAARSAGVSDKDFVSGFDKISEDLQAAGQGVTQFSKLFEANGVAIKDQNGQLITTQAALTDIMNLMQNASPAVQQQIAKIVGLTSDWIPFLKEGADQFAAQKQAAADLGLVIDDATIAKAAEFNAQWHTAVATWDLEFKASIASILPLLMQLATLASSIISTIGAVSGSVGNWLTPDDAKTKSQLNDTIGSVERLTDLIGKFGESNSGFAGVRINNLEGLLGLPEGASISQVDALLDKLQDLAEDKPTQLTVNPVSSTVLPKTDGGTDQFDRAVSQLEKHTAQTEADTAAVGQGAGALAELKAQALLLTAAQQAGLPITQAMADKIQDLAQDAGDAATALAKAKVANEAAFGSKTAFLSSDDVAIATKLKDVYPDVATALNSAEAAQLRFNSAAKGLSSSIENDLVTGLTDIVSGTKSAGQGFTDLGNAVVKSIEQMVIKIAIVQPLMNALQQSISGSGLLSVFGGSGAVSANGSIAGAVGPSSVGGAPLVGLHDGGIVGAEATFARYVHPSYFDQAPKFHGGGIAGDEVPIIAKKGEGVFTEGQMAALGRASSPQVNVTLVESPTGGGGVTQTTNNNGGIDIEIAIAQIAAKSAAAPGAALNRVLVDQLGSAQRLASR